MTQIADFCFYQSFSFSSQETPVPLLGENDISCHTKEHLVSQFQMLGVNFLSFVSEKILGCWQVEPHLKID